MRHLCAVYTLSDLIVVCLPKEDANEDDEAFYMTGLQEIEIILEDDKDDAEALAVCKAVCCLTAWLVHCTPWIAFCFLLTA